MQKKKKAVSILEEAHLHASYKKLLSTLSNIFHRGTVPTIATLQTICDTMHITLAEFFSDEKAENMSPEFRELYEEWTELSPEKKKNILHTMKVIVKVMDVEGNK